MTGIITQPSTFQYAIDNFTSLTGRVGTFTVATTINLDYLSGDMLSGNTTIITNGARQIVVQNLPPGRGLIARFNFGISADGAKLRFGGSSDTYNILVAEAGTTYYIGFVRYSESTKI